MDIEKNFQIIKEIENGKSIEEVAERINIRPERLRAELLYSGGEKGKSILLKEITDQLPVSMDEIIRGFQDEKTTIQIAEEIGVSYVWLREMLSKYESISGEKIQGRKKGYTKRKDLNNEQIVEDYRKGESISKIAKKYNASLTAIHSRITWYREKNGDDIVKEHKKNINKSTKEPTVTKTPIDKSKQKKVIDAKTKKEEERVLLIKEMINQGYSYEEICKKYGRIPKVYYYLAVRDISEEEERDEK